MEEIIKTSKKFWLNKRDFINSLIVASFTAPSALILDALNAWVSNPDATLQIDWKLIVKVTIGAAVGYLGRNFFRGQKEITIAPKQ